MPLTGRKVMTLLLVGKSPKGVEFELGQNPPQRNTDFIELDKTVHLGKSPEVWRKTARES
jgi:hypothetical protein